MGSCATAAASIVMWREAKVTQTQDGGFVLAELCVYLFWLYWLILRYVAGCIRGQWRCHGDPTVTRTTPACRDAPLLRAASLVGEADEAAEG